MSEQLQEKIAELKGIPSEEDLQSLLRKNIVEVDFTKLDGDKRIMKCTKSFDIIPVENQPKSDKESKKGIITVWDLNAQGWRSFKYDRLNSIKTLEDSNNADVV